MTAEYGPRGATVYYCPLCDWTHTQAPVALERMPNGDWAFESAAGRLFAVDAAVEAHLSTHGLIEWLTEVNRLRAEVEARPDPLAPVYAWLAEDLSYPFDICGADKPPWLDVRALAAAWAAYDIRSAEDYEAMIYGETGWPHEETSS